MADWPQSYSTLQFGTPQQYDQAAGVRSALVNYLTAAALSAKNTVTDPFYAFTPGDSPEQSLAREHIVGNVAHAFTDPLAGFTVPMAQMGNLGRLEQAKTAEDLQRVLGLKLDEALALLQKRWQMLPQVQK